MSRRLAFLIDTRYCNNCKTCELACKMERKLVTGIKWRKVRSVELEGISNPKFGENPNTFIQVSMSCNHCHQPQCVEYCPVEAYTKTPEGPVIHDYSKCIGCQTCIEVCPYHAPVFNEEAEKASKCDMCYDRLQAGIQPFCVQSCPNAALKFGDYDVLIGNYGNTHDLTTLPANAASAAEDLVPNQKLTGPSIVIKTW